MMDSKIIFPVVDKLIENLQTQLGELETLQSVYYNPGEIRIEDPLIYDDILAYVNNKTTEIPQCLDLIINLVINDSKFELCVNLSHDYPDLEPDIFVRNHKLNKTQHAMLNKDLNEFISSLNRGEPCIFSAISWMQDNTYNYIEIKNEEIIENEINSNLIRFWIYSHHIYSKTKRKEIVDLANVLKINGFCMPGKPGIICVEGSVNDCNEWWQSIKSMNWKRIFCKVTEECKDNKQDFLKFNGFREMVFQSSNVKCNHMNMGELFNFLEKHSCGYIFKEIFGVEPTIL